jgi:alkylated DNA repair dioxygenase AlkB
VSQLALFDDQAVGPAGLRYAPEFISAADEQELIAGIAALPLQPFQFGAFEGHRRVKSFGFRYDYTLQKLTPSEPIPDWLERTARAVERFGELSDGSVRQVLCTEYDVGVGIGWHRDKPHFDKVFGISLGSACRFRFRRRQGNKESGKWERFALQAEPRSIYLMDGEARQDWEHSIPPVEERRYSITFRTMRTIENQPLPAG